MGALLISSDFNVSNDLLLNSIICALEKLCGETPISLTDSFWTHEFTQNISNLHHLGDKIQTIEQEMMRLCNSLVINNMKTRNLNTMIEHITNLLRTQLESRANDAHLQQTLINLLLLNRVLIKYFVEVLSLEQISVQFEHHRDDDIIMDFYQTLISILKHFLPQLLYKKDTAEIQQLFLEITSLIFSVSCTQLFVDPELKQLDSGSHVLLHKLLHINTDNIYTFFHTLITIISFPSNATVSTLINYNNHMNESTETDTRSSFISQSSIGSIGNLWSHEHEMTQKAEIEQLQNETRSNLYINIHSVYQRWISYYNTSNSIDDTVNYSLLQEHCVLIMLLLSHQTSIKSNRNPFYEVITKLYDGSIDEIDDESLHRYALNISFENLFEALVNIIDESVTNDTDFKSFSSGTLLIYTLLANNLKFKEYVFAYTEIDKLILPLLRYINHICYKHIDIYAAAAADTIYVVLIIFLIFSSDSFFKESCFTQIIYGDLDTIMNVGLHTESVKPHNAKCESTQKIAWYRKIRQNYISHPISLGNLAFIIMIELFQQNVVHLRDSYIHENCCAILCNMAPFCTDLHFYGANKIVHLTCSFVKKTNINMSTFMATLKLNDIAINKEMICKYMDLLSVTKELLSVCNLLIFKHSSVHIPHRNKFVIYCLMNIEKELSQCLHLITSNSKLIWQYINCDKWRQLILNLKHEIIVILQMIHYFHERVTIEADECGTALDIKHVMNIIHKQSLKKHEIQHLDASNSIVKNDKFQYEESESSIEFLLPFIWKLICKHSAIHFLDDRIKIFKSSI